MTMSSNADSRSAATRWGRRASDRAAATARSTNALVALAPAANTTAHGVSRPLAALVTQLLAIRLDVPQMRQRRRADPQTAAAHYKYFDNFDNSKMTNIVM